MVAASIISVSLLQLTYFSFPEVYRSVPIFNQSLNETECIEYCSTIVRFIIKIREEANITELAFNDVSVVEQGGNLVLQYPGITDIPLSRDGIDTAAACGLSKIGMCHKKDLITWGKHYKLQLDDLLVVIGEDPQMNVTLAREVLNHWNMTFQARDKLETYSKEKLEDIQKKLIKELTTIGTRAKEQRLLDGNFDEFRNAGLQSIQTDDLPQLFDDAQTEVTKQLPTREKIAGTLIIGILDIIYNMSFSYFVMIVIFLCVPQARGLVIKLIKSLFGIFIHKRPDHQRLEDGPRGGGKGIEIPLELIAKFETFLLHRHLVEFSSIDNDNFSRKLANKFTTESSLRRVIRKAYSKLKKTLGKKGGKQRRTKKSTKK